MGEHFPLLAGTLHLPVPRVLYRAPSPRTSQQNLSQAPARSQTSSKRCNDLPFVVSFSPFKVKEQGYRLGVETRTQQLEANVHSLSLEFGTKLDFLFIVGRRLKKHYFCSTPYLCSIVSREPRFTTARGWKALLKNKQMNKQTNNRQNQIGKMTQRNPSSWSCRGFL